MTNKTAFTSSQWQLIKDSPYWVQTALTTAEGRMGMVEKRKEAKALESALKNYKARDPLTKAVLAAQDGKHGINVRKTSNKDAINALKRVRAAVASKGSRKEADGFNAFLLSVGNAIAKAASEGLIAKGDKISDDEAEALANIADALEATAADKANRAAVSTKKRQAKLATRKKQAEAAATRRADSEKKRKAAAAAKAKQEAAAARVEKARARAAKQSRIAKNQKIARDARQKRIGAANKRREEGAKQREAKKVAQMKTYTVKAGDTLGHIALAQYGSAVRWKEIFEANTDQLKSPNLIRPGQVLRIP